jgi:hypothetical protein
MQRIFQIHIAEEARHTSFAHQWLRHRVPRMKRMRRFTLSLFFPVIMRALLDVIMKPSKDFWVRFDIPDGVRKGIDGRGTRYRSEPDRAPVSPAG